MNLLNKTHEYIREIPFVSKINFWEQRDSCIYGNVEILFEGLTGALSFDVRITSSYPLRSRDSEMIQFSNKDLVQYGHVMKDGLICIRTLYNINLKNKLQIDFLSLKNWIVKYYINKEVDVDYEHVIVAPQPVNKHYLSYIFSDVDYSFRKGDFGEVNLMLLNKSKHKGMDIQNCLVQSFILNKNEIRCQWNDLYVTPTPNSLRGLFYFIEDAPATYGRFIYENWSDLKPYLSDDFLNLLHLNEKMSAQDGAVTPLFLGYRISSEEIHWQAAILKMGEFPIRGVAQRDCGLKQWKTELINHNINWAYTRNASYKYFFGRGALCDKLTKKKILIIGVGAIGSMIAKTLTKGGCRNIDIVDFDTKEPENVCRSEYRFDTGVADKIYELPQILLENSPFVNVHTLKEDYFEFLSKFLIKEEGAQETFVGLLNQYDLIFDCSTDNDLMYVLDSLKLNSSIVNLSITNHANELVGAFYPNVYHFVTTQFNTILNNDTVDLYTPTGCWSPTFKASYNDINLLVQAAIKHINKQYQKERRQRNFVIRSPKDDCINLNIEEF